LLHWAVACEMMSSDRQCEQTGVDRVARDARRLTIWAGSWFKLNGLRSKAWGMSFPSKVHEICSMGT